jgi:hypothetical protein
MSVDKETVFWSVVTIAAWIKIIDMVGGTL